MRKFDIEEAKNGAKVCTSTGIPVKIITFNGETENYPIEAIVDPKGTPMKESFTEEGYWDRNKKEKSKFVLNMVPAKHEYFAYAKVNESNEIELLPKTYDSKKEAYTNCPEIEGKLILGTFEWIE